MTGDHSLFFLQFTAILDTVLQKLSRYDEGTLLASIFSFAKQTTSGTSSGDLGREYVNCLRSSMEQIRQKVIDDLFTLALFEKLYTSQMTMICNWLTERVDRTLHSYQVNCLSFLIKKTFAEFEHSRQGIPEDVLNFKNYQTIQNRMRLEEATAAVSEASSATRSPRTSALGMFEKAKKLALS
ncbi:calcium-dependent secretion activator-like [Paramacrobiotus metropolitanus]|uniref:calcium-dependent secretion activator-like n=1 Tax=Paramacrobiotus metropolitanus TaxID=2943436 RepID=UPI0024456464|nr:calcium-dependent secretion activator-like [Paramacrobiotus metropolitanus]